MAIERAIWYPFWYKLDQPLEAGQAGDFDFFHIAPSPLANEGLLAFYYGDWSKKHLYFSARKYIVSIHHPQLGSIQKIDTRDLDYTLHLSDGREFKVDAEENPGLIYNFPQKIENWRVLVEMESAPSQ